MWTLKRERARYDAERARRQYDAVEPENRLVARSLERVWDAAMGPDTAGPVRRRRFPGILLYQSGPERLGQVLPTAAVRVFIGS